MYLSIIDLKRLPYGQLLIGASVPGHAEPDDPEALVNGRNARINRASEACA
jgi:hypothetical protein